jgi:hypothetical protein
LQHWIYLQYLIPNNTLCSVLSISWRNLRTKFTPVTIIFTFYATVLIVTVTNNQCQTKDWMENACTRLFYLTWYHEPLRMCVMNKLLPKNPNQRLQFLIRKDIAVLVSIIYDTEKGSEKVIYSCLVLMLFYVRVKQ